MSSKPRFLLAIGVLLLVFQGAAAQPGILQPTSGPGGGPIHELALATDGDLFAFARGLQRSSDSGWSWHDVPAPSGTNRLAAGLAGEVWVWGIGGTYRTTDDGASWVPLLTAPTQIRDLVFDTVGRVYAATTHGVYISSDSGATWIQASGVPGSHISAIASAFGVISAASGRAIYRTEDGGGSWTQLPDLEGAVTALAGFPDGCYAGVQPGWTTPIGGVFRVASNGTATRVGLDYNWIEKLKVRSDGMVFVASGGVFDGFNPYGMGLFRSVDGSAPWTQVGCSGYVGSIACGTSDAVFVSMLEYFTDYGLLPACGVMATSGPGMQWTRRNRGLGGATIYDLATSAAGVVYAAADWSIAWTDDHGLSWNEVEGGLPQAWPEPDFGIWNLAAHPDGTLFAMHPSEPLYRSNDRGRTWTTLNSPPPFGLTITAQGSLILGTGAGHIWRSTDLGDSWTQVRTGPGNASIRSMTSGPLDRVAASTYTEMLIGENDGTTWQTVLATNGRAAFSPDEHALYVANGLNVRRWLEGAGTWTSESMPAFPSPGEVVVDAEGRVYVANGTSVAWTQSGDPSWHSLGGTSCSGWYIGTKPRLVFGTDDYLYFGTSCDGVYRSSTPVRAPTSVADPGHGILATWGCAPNPARGGSTVTFSLVRSSPVQVSIFDIRGRLVETLANAREFEPGLHAVQWTPAREISSGVYTYRVQAGDVARSGRVVLIR